MEDTVDSVRALSYRELQTLAKSLNVKAVGKREDLLERLLVSFVLAPFLNHVSRPTMRHIDNEDG